MSQPLEVKKMKQGMSYSCKEKTIILNVFKYFRTQYPDKCVTEIVRRTAKATGCSEKSVFHFRKEEVSPGGFKEPCKTKTRKNININSRFIKYDTNVRQAIKNVIYDLKYKNVVPSINAIRRAVNSDNTLPNFSSMTLRRLLFDMGFYYEKNGTKSILMEKNGKNEARSDSLTFDNKKIDDKNDANMNQNNELHKNAKQHAIPVQHVPNIQSSQVIQHIPANNHIYQPIHPSATHRVIPMHISQQDSHLLNPMHNTSSGMFFNHRMPPHANNLTANNVNINLDKHFPMHHHNSIVMQQQI